MSLRRYSTYAMPLTSTTSTGPNARSSGFPASSACRVPAIPCCVLESLRTRQRSSSCLFPVNESQFFCSLRFAFRHSADFALAASGFSHRPAFDRARAFSGCAALPAAILPTRPWRRARLAARWAINYSRTLSGFFVRWPAGFPLLALASVHPEVFIHIMHVMDEYAQESNR